MKQFLTSNPDFIPHTLLTDLSLRHIHVSSNKMSQVLSVYVKCTPPDEWYFKLFYFKLVNHTDQSNTQVYRLSSTIGGKSCIRRVANIYASTPSSLKYNLAIIRIHKLKLNWTHLCFLKFPHSISSKEIIIRNDSKYFNNVHNSLPMLVYQMLPSPKLLCCTLPESVRLFWTLSYVDCLWTIQTATDDTDHIQTDIDSRTKVWIDRGCCRGRLLL